MTARNPESAIVSYDRWCAVIDRAYSWNTLRRFLYIVMMAVTVVR
jgi:hypothetical protein